MAGSQQFSHSRLTLLDRCPRQYRYRYVERLREAFRTIEAFAGTLVHESLGWLYQAREEGRSPSDDELVDRFHAAWDEKLTDDVRCIREGDVPESHRSDAEVMIRAHHGTTFRDDRRETLAIEPRVTTRLEGHVYVGYVDRLARDPTTGTLHVIDYKTGRRLPRDPEEAALQVRGYGLAVLEERGGVEVELELDYLRHGRRVTETMPREAVPRVADTLAGRVRAALAAEQSDDFPARPGPLCAWCGYRDTCEASPHRAVAEAASGSGPGACPTCGSPLRLRNGRRGPFVGCSGFPRCRYSRDPRPEELPAGPSGHAPAADGGRA